MTTQPVVDVFGFGVVGDHVTLKVFPPRTNEEYYFKYYPATGAWTYEEKDSGEPRMMHEDNVQQLIEMAKTYL